MRARRFWQTAVPLITGVLAGCGGGGGSGYTAPMPTPTPVPQMPTVSFQAPSPASINVGQAVQLNWTSSNATSCTGSSSSNIAEAFNGTRATSGPLSVAPTAMGTVTFTLTCTGAGGNATATSAAVTVNSSIIKALSAGKIVQIGSTEVSNGVDPAVESNPYGLAIAPITSGPITAGDLISCNFTSAADAAATPQPKQGDGSTIVALHPTPGSTPTLIAQGDLLKGCNALTVLADGTISVAAWTANANALVSPSGPVNNPFSAHKFGQPWGEAYVPAKGSNAAALYISNFDGTIDRITLNGDAQGSFTEIAKGFCANGTPGAIYAPSGLTYDASIDTLYIVDTASFSVVAFANVSKIDTDGVAVNGNCPAATSFTVPTDKPTFGGAAATSARVIANGSPLFTPLSAALLADGDLIVTNADINIPDGQMANLAIEVSPVLANGFVDSPFQLDNGQSGALFGIVATVDARGFQVIYFNNDNDNAVEMLTP